MDHSIRNLILDTYERFSNSERELADFFLNNTQMRDFSASQVSKETFVSEATITRFARKLNFPGYREFIYEYEKFLNQEEFKFDNTTQNVLFTYQHLLAKTNKLIDEPQIDRIVKMMERAKYVYVYGQGSSAQCAHEFKIRFMRLGLRVESVDDHHIMKMNNALLDQQSLVIAISMSGMNLTEYLSVAKNQGAQTLFITSSTSDSFETIADEVLRASSIKNLEVGNVISPQFPILVLIDILYAHFLNKSFFRKHKILKDTLNYVEYGDDK